MKRLILLLSLIAPLGLRAASPVGLLPEDKVPVTVADNERNPFGKNAPKAAAAAAVENEESRIRAVIEQLSVGGIMEGRSGRKVLLGGLLLEEGRPVQDVISRQTEKLQVLSIAPDKVEIAFLESDGTPGSRRIVVSLNLTPNVQYRVAKPMQKAGDDASFDGVLSKDEIGATR
jgi:hypothetical protein